MEMNANPEGRHLRDLAGAAEFLACGERTVEKLVALGVLPVVRLPGTRVRRFRLETLEQVARAHEAPMPAPETAR